MLRRHNLLAIVYKLRIHRFIWVPYFVGRTLLGVFFLVLLIIAGAITGPVVSTLQFQIKLPATLPLWILCILGAVSICINISYLLLKSRPDFLTLRIAVVPTVLTFIALSLLTLLISIVSFVAFSAHVTWSNVREVLSDHYTAILLATGSQVSLIALLFGLLRFLSADAVDLDAIGTLIKRLKEDIDALSSGVPPATKEFAQRRHSLGETLNELLKRFDPTPDLAIMPDMPEIVPAIKSFQAFDETADDTALRNELSRRTPPFVRTLAKTIGARQ